jgi:AcrR family transcriptional regulator
MQPSNSSTSPRIVRRREQFRERLIAAASGLIAEKGVEGVRLREITDRADVGFGSFYHHFESKDELVAAVVQATVASLATSILRHALQMEDPAESAASVFRWFIRLAYDEPQVAWLIVHLDRSDELFEMAVYPDARRALERGMEVGSFKQLDVEVTLAYVTGAVISIMRGVLQKRLGPDADVAAAEMLLGTFGLDAAQAADVARRPLPRVRSSDR